MSGGAITAYFAVAFLGLICMLVWAGLNQASSTKQCGAYADTPVQQVPARCFSNYLRGEYR